MGWVRTGLAAVGVLLATAAYAGPAAAPAAAHDQVLSLTPADGATVPSPPTSVRIGLSEPPREDFVAVRVTSPAGRQVAGAPQIDGTTVTVPVTAAGGGRYTAAYRVVSADGHPVSGTWSFTVRGAPVASAPASTTPVAATPGSATSDSGSRSGITLLLVVLGLLVFLGLFLGVAWRGASRKRREG